MQDQETTPPTPTKTLAAVCGLYCQACSLYIATREDPARLRRIADQFHLSEEEVRCLGCRSHKRGPYCQQCRMSACSRERGLDFCSECQDYPCDDLKQFQGERPHRLELWSSLARIKAVGFERWSEEMREHYACPSCHTLNSAYDLKCRACGAEPSCGFVAAHKSTIEAHLRAR